MCITSSKVQHLANAEKTNVQSVLVAGRIQYVMQCLSSQGVDTCLSSGFHSHGPDGKCEIINTVKKAFNIHD